MTNLEKWKQEKIKEIQDMDINKAADYINYIDLNESCNYCTRKNAGCNVGLCWEGVREYLKRDEE